MHPVTGVQVIVPVLAGAAFTVVTLLKVPVQAVPLSLKPKYIIDGQPFPSVSTSPTIVTVAFVPPLESAPMA